MVGSDFGFEAKLKHGTECALSDLYTFMEERETSMIPGVSFTAIDFETANAFRGSPCSVGLVKVVDGRVTQTLSSLCKPPKGHQQFDPFNTMIHGLTEADVRDAPVFGDLWPEVLDFIDSDPLVAHNAGFDLGVIRLALNESKIPLPDFDYYCTLVLSRRLIPGLLSYSLPYVVEALDLEEFEHHNAETDALKSAQILIKLIEISGVNSVNELLEHLNVRKGQLNSSSWKGCVSTHPTKLVENVNPNADPEHPIYGQCIVFTGTLASMSRQEAWDKVCEVGGDPDNAVTKRTTILVQGLQDPSKFRPGEALSGKARKVVELIKKGQKIELMSEQEFLRSL